MSVKRWNATTQEAENIVGSQVTDFTMFSAWEDITSDCTVTFGGTSGGSTKTDYILYNKYLKKYRYKGTFVIGHYVSRSITIVDRKSHARMDNSYITGNMNRPSSASAGCEFSTYGKTSNSVSVYFYNRNSDNDWGTCELSFEVDCS